ncbi:MAG: GntG family PLP-dependent aldolase [Gemmatimonadota bacterium]
MSTPVDLRSDTVTRPTPGMRAAIAAAEVGDDALGEDPSVQALEARVAAVLGKEAALFFPSGIMANQAALAVLGRPGTEAVAEARAHVIDWELGAAAMLSGIQLRPVPTEDGVLRAAAVEAAIRPDFARQLRTSLICLENTHNGAGGRIQPLEVTAEVRALANRLGLPVHLDGARLWNAAVASGQEPARYAEHADTVMVALSKGLGCPVGSLLAGRVGDIDRAREVRRRLGGSMRQAGILAAAGLYALDHHMERLAEDHRRARALAEAAGELTALRVVAPDTNIVMLDVEPPGLDAAEVVRRVAEHGVRLIAFTPRRVRAVTHLDVDDQGIDRAIEALRKALA